MGSVQRLASSSFSFSFTLVAAVVFVVLLQVQNATGQQAAADGPCKCDSTPTSITCSSKSSADGRTSLRTAFGRCLRSQNGQTTQIQMRNTGLANLNLLTSQETILFANVRSIDLRNNRLLSINGTTLIQLAPLLQNLSLSGNLLNEFPYFPVGNRLAYLSVANNQISGLNGTVLETLTNLKSLDVSNNDIAELPARFFQPQFDGNSLIELNLGGNRIVNPCNISSLNRLQTLRLNRNDISLLSRECFINLPNLRTLDLSGNSIDVIEGLTFKSLSSITTLILRNNKIASLHDGAFFFQQVDTLERLDLDFNEITSIEGKWLYSLGQLKVLSLANNRISRICDGAWDFTKQLVELDLKNNDLQVLDADRFKGLVLLQRLSLAGNQLTSVERDSFSGLISLQSLDLANNNLTLADDPIFSELRLLRELNLSNNSITLLSASKLTGVRESLRSLALYDNPIRIVVLDTFRSMRYLETLRLRSVEFVCDCSLLDFISWYKEYAALGNGTAAREADVVAVCGSPSALRGLDVFDLTVEDLRCDSITRPTLIREPNSEVRAMRHQNLTLECVAQVSDDARELRFGWVKDNEPVVNSSHVQVLVTRLTNQEELDFPSSAFATRFLTVRSVLHFRPIDYADAGTYQCVVQTGDAVAFSARSQRTSLRVYVPPQLTVLPQNAAVKLGDTVKLECAASGDPPATISWNKDGNRDFPAARQRRIQFVDGDTALLIVDVAEADAGVYTCVASNLVGRAIANASLRIIDAPPRFVEPTLRNIAANRSSNAILSCFVEASDEVVDVRWFFLRAGAGLSDEPQELRVTPGRYRMTPSRETLIVVNVGELDIGTYTCVAANSAGSRRQSAQLTIVDWPTARSGGRFGGPLISGHPTDNDETFVESDQMQVTTSVSSVRAVFTFSFEHVIVIVACLCVVVTSSICVFIFWLRTRRTRRKARKRCEQANRFLNQRHRSLLSASACEDRDLQMQSLLAVAEPRLANSRITPVPIESAEMMTKRSTDSDYASSESHSNGELSPSGHIFAVAYTGADNEGRLSRSILQAPVRPSTLQLNSCGVPLNDNSPLVASSCFGCVPVSATLQGDPQNSRDRLSRSIPLKRRMQQLPLQYAVPPSETVLTSLVANSRSPSVYNNNNNNNNNGSLHSSMVQSYIRDTPTGMAQQTGANQSALVQSVYSCNNSLQVSNNQSNTTADPQWQQQQEHHLRVLRASQSYCRIVDALTNGVEYEPLVHNRLVHFAPTPSPTSVPAPVPVIARPRAACISLSSEGQGYEYEYEQLAGLCTVAGVTRPDLLNHAAACDAAKRETVIWVENSEPTLTQLPLQMRAERASVIETVETNVDS